MFKSLKTLTIVYFILMWLYFVSIHTELVTLHNLLKPLFMIVLIWFLTEQFKGAQNWFSKLIIFGLFFSWIGDIALMISKEGPYFIIGLGSFLIAHLGYSAAFYLNIKASDRKFNLSSATLSSIPFLALTVPFYNYIKEGLIFVKDGVEKNLTVPVLAYTIVITLMGISSAWRYKHVAQQTFNWMLIGAILFILSDCVLALNIFSIRPEPFSDTSKYLRIANMLLYLGGQYMIAVGAAKHSSRISQVEAG